MVGYKISQVLRIMLPVLSKEPFPTWTITGSLGFALQGMVIDAHDVDLQTDADGAYETERRLSRYSVRRVAFSGTDRIRLHFGAWEIDGIRVKIMGALQKFLTEGRWEEPAAVNSHQCWVGWGSLHGIRISGVYHHGVNREGGNAEAMTHKGFERQTLSDHAPSILSRG